MKATTRKAATRWVFADGLPIGVPLVGRMWDEPTLFAVARPLVEALGGVPAPPLVT